MDNNGFNQEEIKTSYWDEFSFTAQKEPSIKQKCLDESSSEEDEER